MSLITAISLFFNLFKTLNKTIVIIGLLITVNISHASTWNFENFTQSQNYWWMILTVGMLLILFTLLVFIIIWNRKLTQEIKLRQDAESQLLTVIDSIPLQIIVTAQDGKVLNANPMALNDYKIDPEHFKNYNVLQFYSNKADRQIIVNELENYGRVEQKIISFKQPDGSNRSMMLSISPIYYHKTNAYLAIAVDMTQRMEIESALNKAKEEAESANKAKSEFLANMSHEIRTPMNAVIGFAEILNDQIKDPLQKGFINTIQNAGNNLLTIINDILDLSKIEAGKLHIVKKPCNPYVLFTHLIDIFVLKISSRDIDFILDIDPNIPECLLLDEVRLRQVLFNLIGNALKFTETGHIKLKAYTENHSIKNNTLNLIIAISDTGMGISDEQQTLVFKAFEQSKDQDMNTFGGTGLGLSISQRLMKMMNGKLTLKSKLKQGSTFTLSFNDVVIGNTVDVCEDFSPISLEVKFDKSTILVVDDIKNNRELVKGYFSNSALIFIEAKNGLQAVELVKKHNFDLVFMDLRMPIMDGYQAAQEIKKISPVPIVALTASVMTNDFERIRSEDFQGYLRKPILKKKLISEMCRFLSYSHLDHKMDKRINNSKLEWNVNTNVKIHTKETDDKNLPKIILQLKALMSQYESVVKSNKISDIKLFCASLMQIDKHYPLNIVAHYVTQLNNYTEAFDITGIKNSLLGFPLLVNQLEKRL